MLSAAQIIVANHAVQIQIQQDGHRRRNLQAGLKAAAPRLSDAKPGPETGLALLDGLTILTNFLCAHDASFNCGLSNTAALPAAGANSAQRRNALLPIC